MNHFNSIRELLNTLNRGNKLIAEMFEKRKSVYRYEYAVELTDNNEDVIKLLLGKNIIIQNGANLELNDQFLNFFEDILEVNEEINISYINEHIQQIKEYATYYLQSSTDSERFKYLRNVKSVLQKIGRSTLRNIVDLNRNIDNAFKTEPNYKIKLTKLENYSFHTAGKYNNVVQKTKSNNGLQARNIKQNFANAKEMEHPMKLHTNTQDFNELIRLTATHFSVKLIEESFMKKR